MVQHLSRAVGGRTRGGAIACAVLAVGCLALGGVFVRLSEAGPIATGGFRSLIAAPMLFLLDAGVRLRRGSQPRERIPLRDHVTIAMGGVLLAIDLCLWNVSFFYTTLAESNLLAKSRSLARDLRWVRSSGTFPTAGSFFRRSWRSADYCS